MLVRHSYYFLLCTLVSARSLTTDVYREQTLIPDNHKFEDPINEPIKQESTLKINLQHDSTSSQSTESQSTTYLYSSADTASPQSTESQSTTYLYSSAETTSPQSTESQSTTFLYSSTDTASPQSTESQSTTYLYSSAETTSPQSTESQSTTCLYSSAETTSPQSTESQSTTYLYSSAETASPQSKESPSKASLNTSTATASSHCQDKEPEVRYDNYKVYTLKPVNEEQIKALLELEDSDNDTFNFWTMVKVKEYPVEIMVSDENYYKLEEFCDEHGLNISILVPNVQSLIDQEKPCNKSEPFSWNYYYNLTKIYDWLDSLIANHSTILTPIMSGYSYENRVIKGAKLSYKPDNPGVFIESGTHAREWIAHATATWLLNELITSNDTKVRKIAENYDWYIFPCVNPDGYVYSYDVDRFWRKTRSPVANCCGVDTNRNWDFKWTGGNDTCSIIYPGPEPFSEIETRNLSEYVKKISHKIQVYLDFHSYSQILMFPYSYTRMHAKNYETLLRIANKSAEALKRRYGTRYRIGDIANTIYVANGSSLDWMYEVLNIPLCYAYELRDTGQTGLLLPPDQIIPTAEETMDSIVEILTDGEEIIKENYANKNKRAKRGT